MQPWSEVATLVKALSISATFILRQDALSSIRAVDKIADLTLFNKFIHRNLTHPIHSNLYLYILRLPVQHTSGTIMRLQPTRAGAAIGDRSSKTNVELIVLFLSVSSC
jgi:hypothetical protein